MSILAEHGSRTGLDLPAQLGIDVVRVDALFASGLQRSGEPSAGQVRRAVAAAIHDYGALGCSARVAHAYGEHPETAVMRMRWARAAAADAFHGLGAAVSSTSSGSSGAAQYRARP
jgi:hypothetical protein